MAKATSRSREHHELVYPAFGMTVLLLLVAYLFPHLRVWGLNFAAFLPWWAAVIGLAALLVGLLVAMRVGGLSGDTEEAVNQKHWHLLAGIITVFFGVLFWVFRTQTQFLGDGYTLISALAQNQPLIKYREIGESMAHIWVRDLLGGATNAAALDSYRAISIGSGVLWVLMTLYVSARLFVSTPSRLLFVLGMMTGGYMLHFFGYVENYALFLLSVGAYTFVGMFVARGLVNRWWILVPQVFAILFHIFGVTLIPATVYLLLQNTPYSRAMSRWTPFTRWLLTAIAALIVFAVLLYQLDQNLFFRIAVLSVLPYRFTIDNYSLFSPAHLVDYLNLLFLLIPGLLILLSLVNRRSIRQAWKSPVNRFLVITAAGSLGAAFIFDPKLGMPRDWDLFAFASIPTLAFLYGLVLNSERHYNRAATVLAIAVSVVVLGFRVTVFAAPAPALAYTEHVRDLDPTKTRNLWFIMMQYHRDRGDAATALEMQDEWSRRFPELEQNRRAYDAYYQGRYFETIKICRSIIEHNPSYADAWLNAGVAFRAMRQTDSALYYLEVANALSPRTPSVYINLAAVMIDRGLTDRAQRLLDEAIATDSNYAAIYYQYARIQRLLGDQPKYIDYLRHAAIKLDADPSMLRELTAVQLQVGNTRAARAAFELAIRRGLDSTTADSLRGAHPELTQ